MVLGDATLVAVITWLQSRNPQLSMESWDIAAR